MTEGFSVFRIQSACIISTFAAPAAVTAISGRFDMPAFPHTFTAFSLKALSGGSVLGLRFLSLNGILFPMTVRTIPSG